MLNFLSAHQSAETCRIACSADWSNAELPELSTKVTEITSPVGMSSTSNRACMPLRALGGLTPIFSHLLVDTCPKRLSGFVVFNIVKTLHFLSNRLLKIRLSQVAKRRQPLQALCSNSAAGFLLGNVFRFLISFCCFFRVFALAIVRQVRFFRRWFFDDRRLRRSRFFLRPVCFSAVLLALSTTNFALTTLGVTTD